VWRDVERQVTKLPAAMQDKVSDLLTKTKRLLTQKQKDKNKLYSLHAPEAECIAKGKSRQPTESVSRFQSPLRTGKAWWFVCAATHSAIDPAEAAASFGLDRRPLAFPRLDGHFRKV